MRRRDPAEGGRKNAKVEVDDSQFVKYVTSALCRAYPLTLTTARKRAISVITSMDNDSWDNHRLYRKRYDHHREEWVERVVIPAGGLKSL